eukprot:91644-Chlamydomonas_euryale.AAC.1
MGLQQDNSHGLETGHFHGLAAGHSHGLATGHSHGLAIGHSHGLAIGHSHGPNRFAVVRGRRPGLNSRKQEKTKTPARHCGRELWGP